MKELQTTFKRKGNTYTQVYVSDILYIYKVECKECSAKPYWELFRPMIRPASTFVPYDYVMYPTDESFGNWAWCCSSLGSVRRMLEKHFEDDAINTMTDEELLDILTT